jgi:hypothetical protein
MKRRAFFTPLIIPGAWFRIVEITAYGNQKIAIGLKQKDCNLALMLAEAKILPGL